MYKHSPTRNQRSKGFKIKQVLQICILVAVCFWLIYQVKHSHDKRKAFEENDESTSLETNSHSLNLGGRKGIQDPLKKKPLITEKKDEEETENENGVEEDDNKHEDEEQGQEEDNNNEEKSELEIEHEVDILDEERDREEVNEDEENENDKETQNEDVSHVEDHDHEAREEQYKGDDASSAVTHESESLSAEIQKGNPEHTLEKMESNLGKGGNIANNTEETNVYKNTTGIEEKGKIAEIVISLNVTKEKEKSENVSSNREETPVSNSTTIIKSNTNQQETGNDLAKKNIEVNDVPVMNSSDAKLDAGEGEINTNLPLNHTRSYSNSIDSQNIETVQGESSNASITSKIVVSEKEKTDRITKENRNENLESEKETVESETEKGDVDHHDPIDDSDFTVSLEKDVKTDLNTLSHIRTERSNDE